MAPEPGDEIDWPEDVEATEVTTPPPTPEPPRVNHDYNLDIEFSPTKFAEFTRRLTAAIGGEKDLFIQVGNSVHPVKVCDVVPGLLGPWVIIEDPELPEVVLDEDDNELARSSLCISQDRKGLRAITVRDLLELFFLESHDPPLAIPPMSRARAPDRFVWHREAGRFLFANASSPNSAFRIPLPRHELGACASGDDEILWLVSPQGEGYTLSLVEEPLPESIAGAGDERTQLAHWNEHMILRMSGGENARTAVDFISPSERGWVTISSGELAVFRTAQARRLWPSRRTTVYRVQGPEVEGPPSPRSQSSQVLTATMIRRRYVYHFRLRPTGTGWYPQKVFHVLTGIISQMEFAR